MRYTYTTFCTTSNISICQELEFDTTSPSEVATFERLHRRWTCGAYDATDRAIQNRESEDRKP